MFNEIKTKKDIQDFIFRSIYKKPTSFGLSDFCEGVIKKIFFVFQYGFEPARTQSRRSRVYH